MIHSAADCYKTSSLILRGDRLFTSVIVKLNLKQSLYRLGYALSVPGV